MVLGFGKASDKYGFCSNWYKAPFIIDDVPFNCCEQYMMYSKAMLFNDLNNAGAILASDSPEQIKLCGRLVRNFNPAIWEQQKEEIVGRAVMAKFIQNPDLGAKLDKTGDNILAEASTTDLIGGTGLTSKDYRIQNPDNGRGQNLLGQIVMQVRYLIRAGETKYRKIEK